MIETDEDAAPEPVTIRVDVPQELYWSLQYTAKAGLDAIRQNIKDLDFAYNKIPQFPKPNDKFELPLCADVPIDRDALRQVISYYRDKERDALKFIELLEERRKKYGD